MEIITKDDLMETDPDPDPVEKEDINHQNNGPAPAPADTKTTEPPSANNSGGRTEADVTSRVIDVDGDDATKVCVSILSMCCFSIVCSGHSTAPRPWRSARLQRCRVCRHSKGDQEYDQGE